MSVFVTNIRRVDTLHTYFYNAPITSDVSDLRLNH